MKATADVVIIGGGIQGVSALYYLAEAGVRDVQLVEMDRLGSGTTAYTAAWFVSQARTEPNTRLSQLSLREFLSFEEKFGTGIDFQQIGTLSINTSEHTDEMLELADFYRSFDVPIEVFPASAIRSMAPFLNVSDVGVGLFCSDDGRLDASAVLHAYSKHARNLGAEIDEGVKATNIIVRRGKIVGVETTHGSISTPIVVNAAGIYDRAVARWAGVDLPTAKAIRYTVITEPTSLISKDMTLIEVLNPEAIYISREGELATYSVGLEETDSYEHFTVADRFRLFETYGDQLLHRMPELAQLGIAKCFGGIRSVPTSRQSTGSKHHLPHVGRSLPMLGPVDGVEGYINDCGWGGLGVSHAPAAGKLIAEWITGADTMSLDIEPFLLKC